MRIFAPLDVKPIAICVDGARQQGEDTCHLRWFLQRAVEQEIQCPSCLIGVQLITCLFVVHSPFYDCSVKDKFDVGFKAIARDPLFQF
jgi:hypothetical protein